MKRYFIVFAVFFLVVSSVYSQELTIKSFKVITSDLSAQTQPRKDLNDKNCALVKVQFVGGISEIEGNVIAPLIKHGNETWVYMPQGSRMLKVKHSNYSPIMVTFSNYGVEKLESSRTYQLTMSAPSSN